MDKTMCRNVFFVALLCNLLNVRLSFENNSSLLNCNREEESKCVLCKPFGCMRCESLIVVPSRECVAACPLGHSDRWSTLADFMGRVCVHTGYLSTRSAAAIALGTTVGLVACLIIVSAGFWYVQQRRNQVPTSSAREDEFRKQLAALRPHADTLLAMLNDTRRQIRQSSSAAVYLPVVRDLARILLLVNQRVESLVTVPDEWDRLHSWAIKTLERYERMSSQDVQSQQMRQLVTFLQQSPAPATQFSTNCEQRVPVESVAVLSPHWHFHCEDQSNTECLMNTSYLLEDDFIHFGFRPQDQITTEL